VLVERPPVTPRVQHLLANPGRRGCPVPRWHAGHAVDVRECWFRPSTHP